MPDRPNVSVSKILAPLSVAALVGTGALVAFGGGGSSPERPAAEESSLHDVRVAATHSFEGRAHGWRSGQAAVRRISERNAPHGRSVLRATNAGPQRRGVVLSSPSHASTRGAYHRAHARVRAAGPASRGVRVRLVVVEQATGSAAHRVHTSPPLTLTDRFRFVEVTTPRITGPRVTLRVVAEGLTRGQGFDVDAVVLTAGSQPRVRSAAAGARAEQDARQRPYDPRVHFNRPIPRGAALHPRSDAIVSELSRFVASRAVNAPVDGEVPPVYVVGNRDPFYTVEVAGRTERFRVPAGAEPGTGADHPLVILDPRHPEHGPQVELRVWRASVDHERRRIEGDGTGLFHYNNDGERLNPDGSPSVSVPFLGSGTGSGLSYSAGLLRPDGLPGPIRHAIRVSWGCNGFNGLFRAPAVRTDQRVGRCDRPVPESARVSMGTRLRLDPAVNCDARTAPRVPGRANAVRETAFVRMVCRAMQTYGVVILDGTGPDGIVIYMENDTTADWDRIAGPKRFGGYGHLLRDVTTPDDGLARNTQSGIPWSRMQVIR